ncbi:hypothetical protein CSB93_5655 [Pseudomonas paraeruginosa]|uniref:Uncharacterized protein n=1 Tax=Pseudomonas paraeruginosa TaxID=2994495 RepID=A0A2R3IRE6_9PSED|nr:hypothetical protein CSB93_5655 [Pseudomonas paraeruginosa]AWE93433.1 hypothetical protein CSC28_4453 [Pseudomonas paraeruginosa]
MDNPVEKTSKNCRSPDGAGLWDRLTIFSPTIFIFIFQ